MKYLLQTLIHLLFCTASLFSLTPDITFVCVPTKGPTICEKVLIKSIYGDVEITEPVFIALLQSPVLERLKKVTQGGPTDIAFPDTAFTRYDHSVGVAVLLRLFNAPLQEQLAGLVHDVSHTAFSHLGDLIY